MTDPLPPLGLDDLRVSEADRDSEAAFSPSETWWAACDAINAGHKPADVAALLLTLPEAEAVELRDWWRDQCRQVAQEGQGRDALCADLLLCRALTEPCGLDWPMPMIDPYTVLELLDQIDRIPSGAINHVCQAAETHLETIAADEEVSEEEQAERDEWDTACLDVQAWLRTLP